MLNDVKARLRDNRNVGPIARLINGNRRVLMFSLKLILNE